ncbi:PREDICTED: transmembrane protein 140 [Apaloderma vittatum]|uniref:transmembrane protein 140 n=1 Tax=Apaloderma vittatum TaxID=57397 RepID=UPI000521CCE8|nr:PREDICTED: transmembrane protein 140 [Apaloderma vittatum]
MVSTEQACTKMGLLLQRCTRHLFLALIFLKAAGVLALMFYALYWEAGNLVDLPDKRIGFFNFCLWNKTDRELQCLQYKHLQVMGISLVGMVLATICVYASLVLSIFYPIFFAYVKCTEKREGWKVILIVLTIQIIMLTVGLGTFLFETSQWIHPSDFTWGFTALLGTQALLLLLILTVTMYLRWAKHAHPYEGLFNEGALPIKI